MGEGFACIESPPFFFLKGDLHISRTPNPKPPINGPFDVLYFFVIFEEHV